MPHLLQIDLTNGSITDLFEGSAYELPRDGSPRRIEPFNDTLLRGIELGPMREVSFTGAQGDAMQMWLTFPPGFKPEANARTKTSKKLPVLHVIHGGPYAAAGDTFSYRWNPHLPAR